MSAFKKFAGLVAGISAMGAIGVAVAQGVPPNPAITNPALGAGEQSATHTLIGETGVLPQSELLVQTATLTRENEQAVVAPETQPAQPVAATTTDTSSSQVAQAAPVDNSANNTQTLGAGPSNDEQPSSPAPRHDRG